MSLGARLEGAGALIALGTGLFAGLLAIVAAQTTPLVAIAAPAAIAVGVLALLRPVETGILAVLAVPLEAAAPSLGGFLSPAELLFLAAAAGWLVTTLVRGGEIPRSPLTAPFLMLILVHIPGLFLAENQFAVFKQMFMWTALLLLFLAVISDENDNTSIRVAAAVAISGALVAAIAIAKDAGAGQVVAEQGGIVTNRAVGPFASPVLLGTYVMVTIPFQAMFMMRGRADWIRIAGGLGIMVSFAALALALSRSAMAAVAAALIWVMIWWPLARRLAFVGTIVVVALIALRLNPAPGLIDPAVIIERIESITEPGTRTLSLRVEIWKKSPEMIEDNFPFGFGPKNLPDRAEDYGLVYPVGAPSNAHNTVLVIATELGLPGLIAVLWLVIALIGVLARSLNLRREPERSLAVACSAVFVALVVDSVTGYSFGANAYSLAVMLVVAVAARVERKARAVAAEPSEEARTGQEPSRRLAFA